MGKQYDNTNTGVLFKNKKKETEKHPDYTGSINIDGKEYFLGGWKKSMNSSGEAFITLKPTPKDQRNTESKKPAKPADEDDFT